VQGRERSAEVPELDDEARFARASSLAAGEGARDEDAGLARLLANADVSHIGRIVYSSNATFLLELDAEDPTAIDRPLRAVYKPLRGERPLWDFPSGTLYLREFAAYLVDAALGFALVPVTVVRDGPVGPGSVQHFVQGRDREVSARERDALEPRLQAMAALDALLNNADRKSAHLLVTEDADLRGIDNALTFLPYPRQRTVLLEYGGTALPDAIADAVRSLHDDAARRRTLRRELSLLLDADEVAAFSARLRELAGDPVYPLLDPWDGRPFEWW
jgi:uncharacterized repeat protein (TIGR03843 family)